MKIETVIQDLKMQEIKKIILISELGEYDYQIQNIDNNLKQDYRAKLFQPYNNEFYNYLCEYYHNDSIMFTSQRENEEPKKIKEHFYINFKNIFPIIDVDMQCINQIQFTYFH